MNLISNYYKKKEPYNCYLFVIIKLNTFVIVKVSVHNLDSSLKSLEYLGFGGQKTWYIVYNGILCKISVFSSNLDFLPILGLFKKRNF